MFKSTNLILSACVFAVSVSSANAAIISNFDSSLEGWTLNAGLLSQVASGGNPGGFLKAEDTTGGEMQIFAPSHYLGDLSAYNGGYFAFDGIELINPNGAWYSYGTLTIASGATRYSLDLTASDATRNWSRYQVTLDANVWGVSQTQWNALLSNVTELNLNIESGDSISETVGIDNIVLAAVPLPGGLMLFVSGLAALGLTRRTKSAVY